MADTLDQGQQIDEPAEQHLWFGYGNDAVGPPTTQRSGGHIRNPGLLEELPRKAKTCALYIIVGLAGLTIIAIFPAWGITDPTIRDHRRKNIHPYPEASTPGTAI